MSRNSRGGSESSSLRPTSACSNAETSLSPGHHPLGRAISDKKRSSERLLKSLKKDCKRNTAGTGESSWVSPEGVPNLNKVARGTRYSHADDYAETTTGTAHMPEIELERADPEDDPIIVTKDPDILTDKKLKIERTMSKKVQSDDFHPLGTTPSRVTTICEGGTTNDKNGTPSKPSLNLIHSSMRRHM